MGLFVVGSLVAHWSTTRLDRRDHEERLVAMEWAAALMHGSEPSQYGWIPDDEALRTVDESLAASRVAFVVTDRSGRVVRASHRLADPPAAALGFERFATVDPLGRVELVRTPFHVFGRLQGTFVLLKQPGVRVPAPAESPSIAAVFDTRSPGLDGRFLLVGSLVVGLGTLAFSRLMLTGRLNRMTRVAMASTPRSGNAWRFSELGSDEVGRLSAALDVMQRRSHRLLRSMGERENNRRDWLSELSHDLRTPLSALQLRLDNARGATFDELTEAIVTASQDCERIQALASGFMDLAELEVTEDFALEPVMPEELVGRVLRGLAPIAADSGVRLSARLASQPTIVVDGHRMLRALENMVRNAVRYARRQVTISVDRDDSELLFRVTDDGVGFAGLDPGPRSDYQDWHGRRKSGGLGLRVADRVARAHGGRLMIANSEDGTHVVLAIDLFSHCPVDQSDVGVDVEMGSEHVAKD